MFQAFGITLREGLEAFLIVAISLAYLRKTGRQQLTSAVHWGIGVSVLVSIGAAMLFQRANNQALWEGVLALTAAVLVASFVAWLWSRYGYRVNLALFFQVTAVFLAVFVVQLFIYGFHELTEANLFPYSEPLHWATEPYGPDGRYGQYLTYLLVLLPMGWLAFAMLFGPKRPVQEMRQQAAR